jgi:hypothetical protein
MVGCLLLAAMVAPGLHATTAIYHSDAALIDEASLVVTGRCLEVESAWLDRDLVTLARIAVTEVMKGAAGPEIVVVLPGGIDRLRPVPVAVTYPAAPGIAPDEAVLLFLTADDRVVDGYGVVGFSQGKFTMVESPSGKVAAQNLSGLSLAQPDGAIVPGAGRTIAVEAIRKTIRERAARQREGVDR